MSRLHIPLADCQVRTLTDCEGPGNALLTQIETESGSELFCAIGERGVRAEQVASDCADEVDRFLLADVPVGEYLADQLLLPLALGSGGRFLTSAPSLHTLTQVDTLRAFLPVEISIEQKNERAHLITVSPR
jgi:RNA 3'-terminal phosphate cyclase (ATP)